METALIPQDAITLQPTLISQLQDREDFVSYFLNLEEVSTLSTWLKADCLLAYTKRFPGIKSLVGFAQDINQPPSTLINYIRAARAFPAERRIPTITFSGHYQASFADKYDDKKGEFIGEERFAWVEKAADNKWKTRFLQDKIRKHKRLKALAVDFMPCIHCGKHDVETYEYIFYSPELGKPAERFDLHEACVDQIKETIYGKK